MFDKIMGKFILLGVCLALNGCGVYKSKFDCPPGLGVGCAPVSKVQRLTKSNSLDEYIESRSDNNKKYQRHMSLNHNIVSYTDSVMVVHFNRYLDSFGLVHPEKSLTIKLDNDAV